MLSDLFAIALLAASAGTASAQHADDAQARISTSSFCVTGSSTARSGYTMHYQEMKLPSIKSANGHVIDPSWKAQHEIGDPSHYFAGTSQFPWAENKCQYTCNAMKGCVSFVGYQTAESTPDNGEIYCHYFDTIIGDSGIAARAPGDHLKITHAYNKLCSWN